MQRKFFTKSKLQNMFGLSATPGTLQSNCALAAISRTSSPNFFATFDSFELERKYVRNRINMIGITGIFIRFNFDSPFEEFLDRHVDVPYIFVSSYQSLPKPILCTQYRGTGIIIRVVRSRFQLRSIDTRTIRAFLIRLIPH